MFAFCNQIQANEIKRKMMRVRSGKVMKSRGILSLPTAKNGLGKWKTFLKGVKKEKFNQMLAKHQLWKDPC